MEGCRVVVVWCCPLWCCWKFILEDKSNFRLIMAFMFTRMVRYVIFAIVLYSVVQYMLRWKSYSISPKVFRQACVAVRGIPPYFELFKTKKKKNFLTFFYVHFFLSISFKIPSVIAFIV